MSKKIPYKCRFGHITIIEFSHGTSTLGTIDCNRCRELAGTKIRAINDNNFHAIRRVEKAVRF